MTKDWHRGATARCPRCGNSERVRWGEMEGEYYRCMACTHTEKHKPSSPEYKEFRARWNDPVLVLTPQELEELRAENRRLDDEYDREWKWPVEGGGVEMRPTLGDRAAFRASYRDPAECLRRARELDSPLRLAFPDPVEILARVMASPDDDAPRLEYARFVQETGLLGCDLATYFIKYQVKVARSFRERPHGRVADHLPRMVEDDIRVHLESRRGSGWPFTQMHNGTYGLEGGLVADELYFRGFVEHVAMRAHRFLELADELYSLAPIRMLTLTYAKGYEHDDHALFERLLASPHLQRIRYLRLPVRKFPGDRGTVTVLNRLDSTDLAKLAASPNLRGLRYLDLEDQRGIELDGFRALAASPNLPELSAVVQDIYDYRYPGTFSFGTVGGSRREVGQRPLANVYTKPLEAEFGPRPWLRVMENYGTETPDIEAVVEHPIALRRPG